MTTDADPNDPQIHKKASKQSALNHVLYRNIMYSVKEYYQSKCDN